MIRMMKKISMKRRNKLCHLLIQKESGLEALIVKWLVEQNDYEQGTNTDYNRDHAIDETRLFRFLQDTQPDSLAKLGVFKSEMKKKQFFEQITR